MPVRRQLAPCAVEADDIRNGRVDLHYAKTLVRLMSAHALAEELTAQGYERALETISEPELRRACEGNRHEERRHAELLYAALADLGVSRVQAERQMITARRSASFEAPRHFAENAASELDLVMGSLSLDITGMLIIGINYRESSYAPHARAAEMILEDEARHEEFAGNALGHMVESRGPHAVAQALREWLPMAVNFFGPPGSGFTFDCLTYGLKSRDNQELADLYLAVLERRLSRVGLQLPAITPTYPHQAA
jgi:1,2-phenylacetyl-CoA epoxidase catalytic subunit